MRQFKTVLSGKGLLAAGIALASGQAAAEVAGRVSFVTGNVSVTASDGSARALRRGDAINGGDRISTNSGRLQIRFTDGGFVSLQPGTVFGIDEYLYANRKPEESSLFFSLLQGGMRTVTGAIGKVNKQSYKVRTPVATIGIRGTGYRAQMGSRGLIVSVGSGFVNVANNRGDVTAGGGQNIHVPDANSGPGLSEEQADIAATGVNGDEDGTGNNTLAEGTVLQRIYDNTGTLPLSPNQFSLPDSNPDTQTPLYIGMGCAQQSFCESPRYLLATFDQYGTTTGTLGALLTAQSDFEGFSDSFAHGNVHFTNVRTVGSLSWGEITNGTPDLATFFGDYSNPAQPLSDTQYAPYILGTAASTNFGSGIARYTLQGGTPARSSLGTIGRLDSFTININLDFATIDLAMRVTMDSGNVYNVTTPGAVGFPELGTSEKFYLYAEQLQVNGVAGSSICGSAGACANISGFFAGEDSRQLGVSYLISGTADGSITGVAGLGLGSYSNTPTTAPDGAGYSLVYAASFDESGDTWNALTFLGGYNYGYYDNSLTNDFDGNKALQNAAQFGSTVLDRSSSLATNTGRNGNLDWGRWYGGQVSFGEGFAALAANQSLHYITGPMAYTNIFYAPSLQGATAVYSYAGGTTATGSDGSTGTLSGDITVLLGYSPSFTFNLGLAMSTGSNYSLTGGANVLMNSSDAAFFGTLGCTASGGGSSACSASVSGFFAGQQAQQIGLGYRVDDFMAGRTVNGAAAFNQTSLTPANPLIDGGQGI